MKKNETMEKEEKNRGCPHDQIRKPQKLDEFM